MLKLRKTTVKNKYSFQSYNYTKYNEIKFFVIFLLYTGSTTNVLVVQSLLPGEKPLETKLFLVYAMLGLEKPGWSERV